MSKSVFLVSSARDVCTRESEGGDASEARIFQGLQHLYIQANFLCPAAKNSITLRNNIILKHKNG